MIKKERNHKQVKGQKAKTKTQGSDLHKKIAELGAIIDRVEDEKLEVINKLKKVLADYDNLEKNTQKRMDVAMDRLKVNMAKDIIEVVDDTGMAIRAKGTEGMEFSQEAEKWVVGILTVLSKLEGTLAALGIVPMKVKVGDVFSSNVHEAIGVVVNGKPGVVADVVQGGYQLTDGKVVRAAKVVVGKVKA